MEMMAGEAGVLRTALGVVLGMEGIDARVRVYLWSGGVEDVMLPTMNAAADPGGRAGGRDVSQRPDGERDGAGDGRGAAVVAADRAAGVCRAHAAAAAGDQGAVQRAGSAR